jgi:hypothetical protein
LIGRIAFMVMRWFVDSMDGMDVRWMHGGEIFGEWH